MHNANAPLDKLDIRSLRMLKLLLHTRSVTKAGEALSLSQPAASRILLALRSALGDSLLVRGRGGNTLTPRAEVLRPIVTTALGAMAALIQQHDFEPATAKLTVRIATTDHGATVALAALALGFNPVSAP